MNKITAFAHTNIALVKYWGKLPGEMNLPATGSLSLTLDRFGTKMAVSLVDRPGDILIIDGQEKAGEELARVSGFLERVRQLASTLTLPSPASGRGDGLPKCRVESSSYVPIASGLASSASAFAALALAAGKAYGLELSEAELSCLARLGSGSAARSVFGGYVMMPSGKGLEHESCFGMPMPVHPSLDLRMAVLQCASGPKAISSRKAMQLTAQTSAFYQAWLDGHEVDLIDAASALHSGDFHRLGRTMEHSTLKMHATMLGAQPAICYWNETSIAAMARVKRLRDEGAECYFTMDAGPHVKVLCFAKDADEIAKQLSKINGVIEAQICGPGEGAKLL